MSVSRASGVGLFQLLRTEDVGMVGLLALSAESPQCSELLDGEHTLLNPLMVCTSDILTSIPPDSCKVQDTKEMVVKCDDVKSRM